MITLKPFLIDAANDHGVNLEHVTPSSRAQRMRDLNSILRNQGVPFPIDEKKAKRYWELAASQAPFRIGSLTDATIDLGEFANEQYYEDLDMESHISWACLVADQRQTKERYACREYLRGEEMFCIAGNVIPDYYLLNARIYQQTGWQLATVNMIIPASLFFACHRKKFFPVTTFMRPVGTDYLEEPDIGHDVAGHVSTFTIPEVAQVMNNHGLAHEILLSEQTHRLRNCDDEERVRQIKNETVELLSYAGRLYWFTVEFGLVQEADDLKVFGAGILSSPGETRHSIESDEPNRILIDPASDRDLLRLATTDYLISEYQKTYFVLENFESLKTLTPQRIVDVVRQARELPHFTWREIAPGDTVLQRGTEYMNINAKYQRLLDHTSLDECQERTAVRNLRWFVDPPERRMFDSSEFLDSLPPINETIVRQFVESDREWNMD